MLFTLGHSNHSAERFLELLRQYRIEAVADVRSQPVSRFSPHFRKQNLESLLSEHRVEYVWLRPLGFAMNRAAPTTRKWPSQKPPEGSSRR